MPKLFIILSLFILLSVSSITIFAKSDNAKSPNGLPNSAGVGISSPENHGQGNQGNGNNKNYLAEASPSGQASPTCAPAAQWKNHGDYVSCVAKLHQGGQAVSAAAKSDIGKKHASVSASLSPSPSSTSSASPSFAPSPSSSESASISGTLANSVVVRFAALGELIKDFLKNLKHIFSF